MAKSRLALWSLVFTSVSLALDHVATDNTITTAIGHQLNTSHTRQRRLTSEMSLLETFQSSRCNDYLQRLGNVCTTDSAAEFVDLNAWCPALGVGYFKNPKVDSKVMQKHTMASVRRSVRVTPNHPPLL